MMKLCHHIKIILVTLLLLVTFFCQPSLAEEQYTIVDVKIVAVMEGSVGLYLDSVDFEEPIWFIAPPGKDDEVLTMVMTSIVLDCGIFITYDDKTMELLSIGYRGND